MGWQLAGPSTVGSPATCWPLHRPLVSHPRNSPLWRWSIELCSFLPNCVFLVNFEMHKIFRLDALGYLVGLCDTICHCADIRCSVRPIPSQHLFLWKDAVVPATKRTCKKAIFSFQKNSVSFSLAASDCVFFPAVIEPTAKQNRRNIHHSF